ncbi:MULTISPECIES: hypothetical protein [Niastella]|uniref:Uncharacterized protein n=1 Tax=Niastella soli TaxID=2821487 RepID=A0ABS3YYU9_9BACT|nr:hypothetical protein [Niastella soli]MBO9203105.1 hypothetical protein [Niastella soli]
MSYKPLIIRQSKKKQWRFVILTGLMILWYFIGPYEKTRIIYKQNPTFTIILGIIIFGCFFHFLNELVKRKAEIILTKDGIELRDKGFFEWSTIESFSTLYDHYSENHREDLVLHFKEFADLKFEISYLEKNKEELVDLIMQYKGSASLFFVGHNS